MISCRKEALADHLLLHRSKTRVLWASLSRVSWVLFASVKDSLWGWKGSFLAKDKRRVWNAGPLCIFWTVWKAMNGIVFIDEGFVYTVVKVSFCTSFLVGG